MARAIREYYLETGRRVGLKPAGGIRTARAALEWLTLIRTELGAEWVDPTLFRIGASSVLDDLRRTIPHD
jgi:deoxyribose-phosphate aldolase